MIWEPIEKRYNLSAMRDRQMLNSSAFAIAAGVVAVGATAAGTAVSMSAADRAAKAQGAAGRKYQEGLKQAGEQYQNAVKKFNRQQKKLQKEVKNFDPNLNIPQYNLQNATLEGIEAANKVTANTLAQLEQIAPGRLQAGLIINRGLSGQPLSEAQIGEIQRMTAMGQGAASYNPAMAGRGAIAQRGTFDYARALGTSMYQVEQEALGNLGRWQDLALRFYQQPTQMMALGLQGGGQNIEAAQISKANQLKRLGFMSDLNAQQLGVAKDIYGMQTGQAQAGYGVAQQGIESTLAARQAIGSGIQDIGTSVVDAYGGYLGATRQLSLAQGGVNPANYERIYGKAIPVGGQTTAGFGNFDYGV
jgi:hypothetical protein